MALKMNDAITIQPVILCGGSGTRLWPLSRANFPKQFLTLIGDKSLFQQALLRLGSAALRQHDMLDTIVVTGEDHRFLVAEQSREIGFERIVSILEPEPKNTAPAITMAALQAVSDGGDALLVVTPADYTVGDEGMFSKAILSALTTVSDSSITIFGVKPSCPKMGYGYVCAEKTDGLNSFSVKNFVEKPDMVTAQSYLDDGRYYWNAGIFVLKASVWLNALLSSRPDIYHATKAAWAGGTEEAVSGNRFLRPSDQLFRAIPADSIDYAVMENCSKSDVPVQMIELEAGWSDLGSWDTVSEALPMETMGNVFVGDVLSASTTNTLVHASSRTVAVVGLNDIVVIETPDAVLVSEKSKSQNVKDIILDLVTDNRTDHLVHRKVYRPWGWFDVLEEGARFKVKRIQVNPSASLSLQKHAYRSEHWTVVEGVAEVTIGTVKTTLEKNQSTYIPLGTVHRLENASSKPLELIEVQCGDYLGEDDILRFEDCYGR